jgi:heptosyltransferase III
MICVMELASSGSVNWAGCWVMKPCRFYGGNDTGTIHFVAMADVPRVAIFSARDYPGLWELYGKGYVMVRKDIEYSGCLLETCSARNNACLTMISVDEILSASLGSLEKSELVLGGQGTGG